MKWADVLVLGATDAELSRIESVLKSSTLPVRIKAKKTDAFLSSVGDADSPKAVLLCSTRPSRELPRLKPTEVSPPVIVLQRSPAREHTRAIQRLGASAVVSMRRLAQLPGILSKYLDNVASELHGSVGLQALFDTVLASINDVVLVANAKTREIIACNDSARRMFGYTPAELVGRTTEILFPDYESFTEFGDYLKDAMNRWGYCHTEMSFARRDGEEFEADIRVVQLDAVFGLQECVIGTIRDISRERDADRAVRGSMEKLEATLNSLEDVVLAVDPGTRTILHCNPAVEKVFGYRPRELIGQSTRSFFPDKETYEAFGRAYREALERGDLYRAELTIPHRDGHPVDIELTVTPLSPTRGWREGIVASMRDVTERRKAQQEARLARSVLSNTVEAIVITDLDRRIISVNPAFERTTGYSTNEVIGKTPDFLRSGYHAPEFYQDILETVQRDGSWQGEIWHRRKSGEVFPSMASVSVVRDSGGRPTHYTAIFTDISHHKNIQERLEYLVHNDPMTGLPNRRSFEHMAEDAVTMGLRRDEIVAILFLDVDHFKNINESLGHEVGDKLLRAVADRLKLDLRDSDKLARMGGDEFGVIARDISDPEAASTLAKRLLQQLKEPFEIETRLLYVNASVGISLLPNDGQDYQTLMKNADSALFRAKEHGRNSYQFFSEELNKRAFQTLVMVNSLRQALERNEFLLHFQPRLSAVSGEIIGAEALIRWQHPELGLTLPGHFISIAEQTGLIGDLDDWVLRNALKARSQWREKGIDNLRLSINLSANQFSNPGLTDLLDDLLSEHELRPEQVELEVTEGTLMHEPEAATGILRRLRELGIKVTVDDFGTGYSSLNYLKQFPISGLKIDQSFVNGIPDDPDDVAISRAIIALAKSLDLDLVAEGVEKNNQAEFLREAGCHELQGFLYSPAVPEEEFLELVARNRPRRFSVI